MEGGGVGEGEGGGVAVGGGRESGAEERGAASGDASLLAK